MRRAAAWLPPLAWAGLIFVLSSRASIPMPDAYPFLDKAAHFGAYAVLGALLARALPPTPAGVLTAVALATAYGGTDELHQSFVPGRSVEWLDWVADALGAAAGAYLYHRLRARRGRAVATPAGRA